MFWYHNLRRSCDSHSYNTLQTVVWTLGSKLDATFYLRQSPEACYSIFLKQTADADKNVSRTTFYSQDSISLVKYVSPISMTHHTWRLKLLPCQRKALFFEPHLQLQFISQRGWCLSWTEGVRSGSCCPLLAGKISYTDDEILSNANGKTEASHLRVSESGQKAAGCHSHTD